MESGNNGLLILSEAGEGIGYGHYARCCAIRDFCVEKGKRTRFILNVVGNDHYGFEGIENIDWGSKRINFVEDAEDWYLLVDSYRVAQETILELKGNFRKLIVLDDYCRFRSGPDLIINPNVFGNKMQYQGASVGGSDYVILRKAFRQELAKAVINVQIRNVLLTVGGSDIHGLLPKLALEILRILGDVGIDIVAATEEYRQYLSRSLGERAGVRVHGFVPEHEMKNRMLETDLAISACGQTLHELAWLGIPTIGICVGDDQILNMKEYVTRGFLDQELYWDQPDFLPVLEGLINGYASYPTRVQKGKIGPRIVNNNGLRNIYDSIFHK
jgi:spore coat polysaccharide biosynthesis predicted glycosyltransferase SpsG